MNEEQMANLFGYLQEILTALVSIDAELTSLVEMAEASDASEGEE